ncbi:MBL fold metallo-hydrolase [Paracoccus denitrificans]|jgi:phosphoribosyl 1,2-cyclic phosphate phosphodiesterase|uniref:Beta-lactamase domain protein n=1 Tax=Paracoccus denitrificans (strain Pd 1222) TaxID=318586 RepID=A1B3Z5_PARDP|nr:MBL fold metallo-hydrolase [Paracoccus denitrificans]ABL70239.1 beta-lactamase domain protein [Paracoccus denitrificans PD1222]MBB4630097.1 phosphoribosyl 1,2-cyclic phosphate phosphodiesterase [Paracoccus denitrificans]MCU7431434.1 MBL fold metallo-hydrolase [Paracoccus denitrificans]QAR25590.1 MBL fold metallo-hydrolase [Paracoccus denitrificans]UPV94488.1 MBL fold metallo-hydrolase [Paracoccus denitrificans]
MIRATVLGCGSSGGVPRLGNRWGECDPANPRNRRRRCSLLVERFGHDGATRLLIDTGPDLVPQLLDADVAELDAVAYTHAHADHIHGIDDLRQIVFNMRRRMPVWADQPTAAALKTRFGYIFETPPGSSYPPICDMQPIRGPFAIEGAGGSIELAPFEVNHGDMNALGFRIGGVEQSLVYLPDVLAIPEEAWSTIMGCDVFICDALRRIPHPSHAHLALTLEWIARSGCARGVITNMHVDLDYDAVMHETPENVVPAHDGMRIELI